MKQIFVAATRQNHGKTTVSLGLFHSFQQRFSKLAYMKPVGQQYKLIDGKKIDKDVILFKKIYDLQDSLSLMSPIAIPSGFTTDYINGKNNHEQLSKKVLDAYNMLKENKDFILIEGTGHAGVGSVFDMSNAEVAKLLNLKVIIVSEGGIGKPIDEVIMNKALFDQKNIEVLGVIVNKVNHEKYDKINELVRNGFSKHNLKVFGVIPLLNILKTPSVIELIEDLDAELLLGERELLNNHIGKFVIGDKLPHAAIHSLTHNSLLIVPGNRDGIILTGLCGHLLESATTCNVAAMVFTDGIRPHPRIIDLIKRSKIPAMLVEEDSYSVATKINNSIFKLRAEELDKIKRSQTMIEEYVDVDSICNLL